MRAANLAEVALAQQSVVNAAERRPCQPWRFALRWVPGAGGVELRADASHHFEHFDGGTFQNGLPGGVEGLHAFAMAMIS
jgi:hypothetical protein